MLQKADILVIGGGIAGTSVAATLAAHTNVILLERETQPGYHATGRSAAYFAPSYGNETVRLLSQASADFFYQPPSNFSPAPLIRPREAWFIGRSDQQAPLNELGDENPDLESMSAQQVCERVPIIRDEYVHSAMADRRGGDLDVDAILQGYLRQFRGRGGILKTNQNVTSMHFADGLWYVTTAEGEFSAPIIVNAAGAWADQIAEIAGLTPLGIQPLRRTACLVELPAHLDATNWPLIIDADEAFYFKPDAGLLLISPANESPSAPCDAQPDELDIAEAVDRITRATTLEIRRIEHKWAGLRSFAPDKTFVAGFDPRASGFFWLAGQGGYGVQSAPALAELSTSLMTGATLSEPYSETGATIESVAPHRLLTDY